MSTSANRIGNRISVVGLAVAAIFGFTGSMMKNPNLQACLYEFSSLGLIVAGVFLTFKYFRASRDLTAAGFLLLAIAEAAMSTGTASGLVDGQSAFAAGMALYLPGLLLVSIPGDFPVWARVAGIASCFPFAIAALTIYGGDEVLSNTPLPGTGYGLMIIMFIGIIVTLLKEKDV